MHNILLFLGQRKSFLQEKTIKPNKIIPNCKQLYKLSIKMKNQLSKNISKINTFKHRVKLADKFMKEDNFSQIVDKVNSTTYNFIISQLKIKKKNIMAVGIQMMIKFLHCLFINKAPKVISICPRYLLYHQRKQL